MNDLPIRPIVQLSHKAIKELKIVLEKDIGTQALNNLSEKEINHIGCFMLSLTATLLKIKIREQQKKD